MSRQRPSLRAQGVAWLARREHSEMELRRKLLLRLQAQARAAEGSNEARAQATRQRRDTVRPIDSTDSTGRGAGALSDADRVDEVIAWLRERNYLNEDRFVASRVHVRSDRCGLSRIQRELSSHGLAVPPETAQSLRSTELERATALWQRRFGQLAPDVREAARQGRFLIARGFSAEVVRSVLRAATGEGRRGRDG